MTPLIEAFLSLATVRRGQSCDADCPRRGSSFATSAVHVATREEESSLAPLSEHKQSDNPSTAQ